MRIIVEGPDGVGKTTLVRILAEHFGCDILSMTEYGSKKFNDYMAKSKLDQIVSDRSVLSELVYSMVFDRKSEISSTKANAIISRYKLEGWKFIVLDADTETIKKRLDLRGDEDKCKVKNIDALRSAYRLFANFYDLPIYDIHRWSVDNIIKELEATNICEM